MRTADGICPLASSPRTYRGYDVMATVKIEGLLAGAVVDTINLDRTEQTFATASVTSRTIQASRAIPGADEALVTRVGRDATRISIRSVVTTLAAADKLRQIIAKVDTYDEVRLFINSATRFYRLSPESTVTDNPGQRERGFHPITINAVSDDVFEQGAESTPQFLENLTFDGDDKSANAKFHTPNMAGQNQEIADASGNGNHAIVFGTKRVDSPLGPARLLDGVDDYATANELINSVSSDTVGTLLAWINIDDVSPSGIQFILSFGDTDANEGTSVKLRTDGTLQIDLVDGGTTDFDLRTDASPFTADTWHHIAIVQDATEPVIYVDGALIASTFDTENDKTEWLSALAGIDNFNIGRRENNGTTGNFFAGRIQSVTYLNTDLSAAEVLDKYDTEKVLIDLNNNGNVFTQPSKIKITGVDEQDYVDQAQLSTNATINFGTATGNTDMAQSFKPTKENLSKAAFQAGASGGTFVGDVVISIQADSAGDPDGTDLIADTISNAVWEAAAGNSLWIIADLPIKLTPNTLYHAVLSPSTSDDVNFPKLSRNSASDDYLEGSLKFFNATWQAASNDAIFKTFYAENTRNPSLYDDADEDNKFIFGKESIDKSQDFDEDTSAFVIDGAADWGGLTFQPTKMGLSKIKLRLSKTALPGNLVVRVFEYDTTNDTHTGSALVTKYISPFEVSTTRGDVWVRLDLTGLDITKTYIVILDSDTVDGSNFYDIIALTTSGLDDTDTGRLVSSTDSGGTWTESTTVSGVLLTYFPDSISASIPGGSDIEIDSRDGTGDLTFLLAQSDGAKDVATAFEVSGAEYDITNTHWDLVVNDDFVTWKISSQYPMRNMKISTVKVHADKPIALLWSLDNVTYNMFHLFDNATEDTFTDIKLPNSLDGKNLVYIKAEAIATDADNSLSDMTFQADVDNNGAIRPKIPVGTDNIWIQGQDELSSGRATIDLTFRDQYHT